MTTHANPSPGEDHLSPVVQSQDGISPLARWYTGLRMEANGGAPPAAVTPPAGDQGAGGEGGTPGGEGGGGFDWNLFPDVPEEHRPLLEPHLKKTQGHVTQLEQRLAPFKELADAGLDADTVKGIVALNNSFDKDPMGTWVNMGREMQQRGMLPDVLNMEAVQEILEGKEAEEPEGEGQEPGEEEIPQYARELQERLDRREKEDQEREAQQKAQAQEQQLEQAVQNITAQLKEAGLTDDAIAKINIMGPIIANKGDPDAALQEIIGFREEVLKGLTDNPNPGGEDQGLTLTDKGPPKAPDSGLRGRSSKGFAEANKSAKQFLDRQRAAS